jgi:AcrR family transcriptional regulator
MAIRRTASVRRNSARSSARDHARVARQDAYRDLVLQAAGEAFARQGISNTRMEHLAEESGLSLGTLYSVYKGKAEIVDALHEARLREIHAASIAAEAEEANPLDALLAGSRAYIAYFIEHPDYLRMYIEEGSNWGVRDSMDRESRRAVVWSDGVAQLAAIFERGIESGAFEVGRADRLARMMLAMQQVELADWLEEDKPREPAVVMAEVETLIRRAFCTDAWRDRPTD